MSAPGDAAVRLRAAAAMLAERRDREAAEACRAVLEHEPQSAAALHLLGIALTRMERAQEAADVLRRAIALQPASAPCHQALGNALRKAGDVDGAEREFGRALALDPRNGAAAFNLAELLGERGDLEAAARTLARIAVADPMDFEASQRLVDRVAQVAIRAEAAAARPPSTQAEPRPADPITIGFCSVQPEREARARESLARAFAPTPVEFIVVHDARSLAEGFNRIVDATRTERLVLCHDDIEVLAGPIGDTLDAALRQADLVGVAGAARVSGPAVLWAGHPHVHGWVSYPRDAQVEVAPLGFRQGLVGGMQALDGVFMAMRTAAARELRFDAQAFDGFHFYDLDFSYRAHLAGLRLAVSTDILLLHVSEGRFESDWQHYAERFRAKYPKLRGERGAPHWYGAKLPSRAHAVRFYELLREYTTKPDA